MREIRKELPDKSQCIGEAQSLSREKLAPMTPYWWKYAGIADFPKAPRKGREKIGIGRTLQ